MLLRSLIVKSLFPRLNAALFPLLLILTGATILQQHVPAVSQADCLGQPWLLRGRTRHRRRRKEVCMETPDRVWSPPLSQGNRPVRRMLCERAWHVAGFFASVAPFGKLFQNLSALKVGNRLCPGLNLFLATLYPFVLVPVLSFSLNSSSPFLGIYREQSYPISGFVLLS